MQSNRLPKCPSDILVVNFLVCPQAPEQMKERDVFKASHDKQAEAIEQQAGAPSNPSESAQVTLLPSSHRMPASLRPSTLSSLPFAPPSGLLAAVRVCRNT